MVTEDTTAISSTIVIHLNIIAAALSPTTVRAVREAVQGCIFLIRLNFVSPSPPPPPPPPRRRLHYHRHHDPLLLVSEWQERVPARPSG
ncbi:hypothetical protein E2C01_043688 [Portunus trituberculatus]|uniref:Uncharacterized protein n=1 Tax=Portunus trituberculatus TaxID=210409 RepID=A0A5B7FY01_PORTR|nr:hypothetical protein [Portunus trituberculatus]